MATQKKSKRSKGNEVMRKVQNLEGYGEHHVRDYYLAFDLAISKFNTTLLKSDDLNNFAYLCEIVLPWLRKRTRSSYINISEDDLFDLRSKFIKIDIRHRSKEYVKRLMNEVHAHIKILLENKKKCMFGFFEMMRIKENIRELAMKMNRMAALHKLTKF